MQRCACQGSAGIEGSHFLGILKPGSQVQYTPVWASMSGLPSLLRLFPCLKSFLITICGFLPPLLAVTGVHMKRGFLPIGGSGSRLDYVIAPVGGSFPANGSYVLEGIDFGQTSIDHFMVCLHIHCTCSAADVRGNGLARLDQAKMATPEGQNAKRRICCAAPLFPWGLDAHSHFDALSKHIRGQLEVEFPAVKRRRAQSFLTDVTWMLRGHRAWLRKRTANLRRRIDRAEAWAAFIALRKGCGFQAARVSVAAWMLGADALVAELRDTKRELRSSLRKDRLLWIQQTAKAVCDAPVKNVVQRLRPLLGPPRRGRVSAGGLPAVLKLDGTLAQDPDEIRERWIEHFASNEGGRRSSTSALVEACQLRQKQQRLEVPTIAAGELPALLCLEAAFRDCATGRAIGPDGLPAEVLHSGAGGIAAPVYQLLLKTVWRLEEPLAWKGGLIHHLWKGKLAPHLCHGHRSILISSTVGKAVHRTLRVWVSRR